MATFRRASDRPEILCNVLAVGLYKPLGYVHFSTIRKSAIGPDEFIRHLNNLGIQTFVGEGDSYQDGQLIGTSLGDPEVYVFKREYLQALLDRNNQTILAHNWPINADDFVKRVSNTQVPIGTKLYDLIADCFDDQENTGRLELGLI